MELEIPQDERELLASWLGSDDDRFDRVLAAIEHSKPALRRSELAERIGDATSLDHDEVAALVRTFINLIHTVSSFPDDLRKSAASIVFNAVKVDVDDLDRERFERRFNRIINSKVLEVTGKAQSVLGDNQNLFCAARTLSEIRPVFVDSGLDPQAAVIVHQMKLIYHTGPNGDRSEIFMAFERSDLDDLKKTIDRAIEKHEKLTSMVAALNLPLL